jgi:hypothetical protein
MNNQTTKVSVAADLPAIQPSTPATGSTLLSRCLRKIAFAGVLLATAGSALAQTTNITSIYTTNATTAVGSVSSVTLESYTGDKGRLTIPVNQTNTAATEIRVTMGGAQTTLVNSETNFIDPDYYITNYYDLNPTVVTLAATGVPSGAAVVLGTQAITNSAVGNVSVNVAVTLNYTNVASGDYSMAVEATGTSTWRYPIPVKAGFLWSAGGGANTNFNNAANWIGGVPPGANDIVILDTAGAVASATQPTIAITANTTIGSVSDIHPGDNYTHWNIAAGTTLSILGDGGFRQLVDLIDANDRSRIRGSGAGTLVVSNANAEFNMFTTRQNNSHDSADFSALNTMIVDVKKIAFNDIGSYPNIRTNGIVNRPQRNVYDMDWALTNILRATHTDLNGWTNDTREYGFVFNRQVGSLTTGNDGGMHFGLWNELYCDSVLLGGNSQQENPEIDFRAASGSYLLLRNTDKVSRVSNLTIADASDYLVTGSAVGTAPKIDVSFTKGTLDALVDTLILGRDPRVTANGAPFGKLFLGAGVLDVNNAFLGYQTGPGLGTESGAAQGQIDISLGGIFRVNGTMVLGHTVVNSNTVVAGFGQLNVSGAGSSAQINAVTAGGPAGATLGNANQRISVTSGGSLYISNTLCAASARLTSLSMNDSTLGLHVNLASATPYVYVTTLTTGGSGNVLNIASITGSATFPVTIPLISYVGVASPNYVLTLPSGYYGYIVNNSANQTVDAVITTTPPQNLTWNGNLSSDWDLSTANWQGLLVFANGDSAIFDDSASGSTSVTVPAEVFVGSGGVLVSNVTKSYTLASGTISGTGLLTKKGANTLTVNAQSSLPVALTEGLLDGTGTIGATTVATNAVLSFGGTVNKLTTSGASTNLASGFVNIALAVNGGTFRNEGTVNASINTSGGSTTIIAAGSTVNAAGVSTINAGTTLIIEGAYNAGIANVNSRVAVAGHLTGSGSVSDTTGDLAGNNGRLEINPSGVFTPGGSNIIGSFTIGGRFDLNTGAAPDGLLIIDVDLNNPAKNDVIRVDKWSNLRGALFMNNIGAIPFASGQSFRICTNNFGLANTPETAFDLANKITPKVPGVGLQWDLSNLRTNGIIAVISAPLTPPGLTNTIVGGTNLNLTWPTTHIGYQLQVQTNTLSVGISTNWSPITGSEYTNSWNVPITTANPAVFYRLSNN